MLTPSFSYKQKIRFFVQLRLKRIKQRNELYSFFRSRNEVKESLESGILSVKQDDLINMKWTIAEVQEDDEKRKNEKGWDI